MQITVFAWTQNPLFSCILASPGFSRKQRLRKDVKQKCTRLKAGRAHSYRGNWRLPKRRGKPSCVAFNHQHFSFLGKRNCSSLAVC